MLKVYFQNNTTPSAEYSSPLILDMANERYLTYNITIQSTSKQAERLRTEIERIASQKGFSLEEAINKLITYKIQYWQFNFMLGPETTIAELRKNLSKSFGRTRTRAVSMMEADAITASGEKIIIEENENPIYKEKNINKAVAKYKELMNGVYYVSQKLSSSMKKDYCVCVLYCKWLHMINKSQKFLNASMLKGDYRSNKKPNQIIGKYSSSEGKTANMSIDEYTQEYLDTHLDGSLEVNEFYRLIYLLFRDILNYDILNVKKNYYDSDIDNEIKWFAGYFPNEKFNESFLEKTLNILKWDELTLKELQNEYDIEEYDDKNVIRVELPGLKPVISSPIRSLEKDVDYMQMLDIKQRLDDSSSSQLMNLIYTQRLSKLRSNVETHVTYRQIEKKQRENNHLFNYNEDITGYDISLLKSKLIEFKIQYSDTELEDELTKEVQSEIYRNLDVLAKNIYRQYRTVDWNLPEMDDLFAYHKILETLKKTVKIQNGIYYTMGRPTIITDINVFDPKSMEYSGNKFLESVFYVTPEGLLINDKYIIKPRKYKYAEDYSKRTYIPKYFMEI